MINRFFNPALCMILPILMSSCDNGKKDVRFPYADPSPFTVLTWESPGTDATIPRYEAQGLALNGKLYVFGGFYTGGQSSLATEKSDVYDLATDIWTPLAPLPEKITHAGQATDGKVIYLAGGFVGDNPGGSSRKVWKYDIARNSWDQGPSLPEPRGGGALVLNENTLHYFGGGIRETGAEILKDFGDHWTLDLNKSNPTWSAAAQLPNPRNHTGGCAVNGKVYAIGGQHLQDEMAGNQSTLQVYDPGTNKWTQLRDLPIPIGHITANVLEWQGRIFVISGVTHRRKTLDSILEYDPQTNTWASLSPLPERRQSPVSAIIGDRLLVSGGSVQTNTWIGKLAAVQ